MHSRAYSSRTRLCIARNAPFFFPSLRFSRNRALLRHLFVSLSAIVLPRNRCKTSPAFLCLRVPTSLCSLLSLLLFLVHFPSPPPTFISLTPTTARLQYVAHHATRPKGLPPPGLALRLSLMTLHLCAFCGGWKDWEKRKWRWRWCGVRRSCGAKGGKTEFSRHVAVYSG